MGYIPCVGTKKAAPGGEPPFVCPYFQNNNFGGNYRRNWLIIQCDQGQRCVSSHISKASEGHQGRRKVAPLDFDV